MISKLSIGLIIFDQQNREGYLLYKARVIFSNHFSKLGSFYDKQHEKLRNLKRYISWKIFMKKFKKSIALKLPKADLCALIGCFAEMFID